MALELQQGTETKVSITTSSRSEKRWIKVFNSLAEAEVGPTSESKGAIDLKKLKEHLRLESSKKVGFFLFWQNILVCTVLLIKDFKFLYQNCFATFSSGQLKPKTSSLGMVVLSYNNLPESYFIEYK